VCHGVDRAVLRGVLAGNAPRKLSPRQFVAGRLGRGQKPPPQFGQTFASTSSTQVVQKVHSKLQMRASIESGGNAALQCSQLGLSSSIGLRCTAVTAR
jgi:hypothetical protein